LKQKIDKFKYSPLFKYLTESIRIVITTIVPAACFFQFALPETAMAVGISSLLINLIDSAGIWQEKNKAFQSLIILFVIISLIVTFIMPHAVVLGIVIVICTFTCALFGVYGKVWMVSGSVCTVFMIFVIALKPAHPISFTIMVALGSTWSYLVNLLIYRIRPFNEIDDAISACLIEVGKFTVKREALYDQSVPIEDAYKLVISGHELVNEKQETMRLFVLSDNQIIRQQNRNVLIRFNLAIFIIDLYELLRVMPSDYRMIRQHLTPKELQLIKDYINATAQDLVAIGKVIKKNMTGADALIPASPILSRQLQEIADGQSGLEREIFDEILKNIGMIAAKLESLCLLIYPDKIKKHFLSENLDYSRFIDPTNYRFSQVCMHLNTGSPIFRFALRIAAMTGFAYFITVFLPLGQYSYWIMLTIVLVVRPDFSLTHKRNKARLIGTMIGAVVGLFFTIAINYSFLQLAIPGICLLGFFGFLQSSYATSVAFITTMVITGLHLMGGNQQQLTSERLYDTLIGCGLSYLAGFIFPNWEIRNLKKHIRDLLNANISYLENLIMIMKSGPANIADYKSSRKSVYVNSAKLTGALRRIKAEPRKLTFKQESIDRFIVLNYLLYASLSSLGVQSSVRTNDRSEEILVDAINSIIKMLRGELTAISDNKFFVKSDHNMLMQNSPGSTDLTAFKNWQIGYIHQLASELSLHIKEISIK
jgi:uncharacterized membrane protein YccC